MILEKQKMKYKYYNYKAISWSEDPGKLKVTYRDTNRLEGSLLVPLDLSSEKCFREPLLIMIKTFKYFVKIWSDFGGQIHEIIK